MRKLFLASILLIMAPALFAGPGDTITVQTFTYGSPQQNQWFAFPSDSVRFEKILMYYTLKCNPAQNPPCGEWDYLTYTYLHQHTGVMDSILRNRPRYVINFGSPDSILLSNSPSYIYQTSFEKFRVITDTLSYDSAVLASLVPFAGQTFPANGNPGARSSFLWTAQELLAAGFSAGSISGLRLFLPQAAGTYERFRIALASTPADSLSPALLFNLGFSELYNRNTNLGSTGWQSFTFNTPYVWDGVSNLVISLSYESVQGATSGFSSSPVSGSKAIGSHGYDGLLEFDGSDLINLPVDSISGLNQQASIALWRFGDPVFQPQAQSTFFAVNNMGSRLVNAHIPWSNGTVYWDAGWVSNNYDRINKAATAAEYKGSWSHWVFTKNASNGSMKIYRNGQLWHSGTGMIRPMGGIASFWLGGMLNSTADRFDDAYIDEFGIWNRELSPSEIQRLMFNKPDTSSGLLGGLLAYYDFDEAGGSTVSDRSGNSQGAELFGRPQRLNHDEEMRIKDFQPLQYRPNIILERGTYVSYLDSVFVLDSTEAGMVSVLEYADSTHPNIATDTLHAWLPYQIQVFDSTGTMVWSMMSPHDTILTNSKMYYYDPPFEIVNRYELGRFITPYGINLDLGDGWTWVYDVSDFRPLLHDSVKLSAGNWQELLDLKFIMIEGTPPRDVLEIKNVWTGNFNLSSFNQSLVPKTIGLNPSASMWRLRSCVSGHQFDNATNCAEFCPKIHSVWVNDTMRYSWQILQECADNPLYPQGGTWIYDRAGWCPGMEGAVYFSELSPFIHSDSVKLDYESESDPFGNYVTEIQLVSYSEPNHPLDAAVTGIIAPSNWELRSRRNPICSRPEIEISNLGSQMLQSATIQYRFAGDTFYHYQWTGSLPFLGKERVILPGMDFSSSYAASGLFEVTISQPNAGIDLYPHNNSMKSEFNLASVYNKPVIIWFKSNYYASENHYEVFDAFGNLVFSKGAFSNNTLYKDTLLLPPGCYELVMHDSDDDGISFWANNDGAGYLRFYAVGGGLVKNFQPDFGKEIRFQFSYADGVGIHEPTSTHELLVGPNPGQGKLQVVIPDSEPSQCRMDLYDMQGRLLRSWNWGEVANETLILDIRDLPASTYQLVSWLGGRRYHNSLILQP
jgi:hypothetical protein